MICVMYREGLTSDHYFVPLPGELSSRPRPIDVVLLRKSVIQTEAERRRREAGVKQSMEIRLGSCMWVGGWVGVYGIWNYLANQGT